MKRLGTGVYLLAAMLGLGSTPAFGQAQKMDTFKPDLPPSPNFNVSTVPEQYPDGTMSVYGLRHKMNKYLDKDVQVKGVLLELYECPEELRKCNDELAAKSKKEKKKNPAASAAATGAAPGKVGATPAGAPQGGCRPCDQPHFFIADSMNVKKERALLVADYPIKDWDTGKPKPLVAKAGDQFIVTGTFAINSIGGFAASDGLIIHKKLQDSTGKIVAEGNAVLPPDAQTIKLEGRPEEKVGGARIDAKLPQGGDAQAGKAVPKGAKGGGKGMPKEL